MKMLFELNEACKAKGYEFKEVIMRDKVKKIRACYWNQECGYSLTIEYSNMLKEYTIFYHESYEDIEYATLKTEEEVLTFIKSDYVKDYFVA